MNTQEAPSLGEVIEAFGIASAAIDSQFEFWVTITFAVIVSSYIAGDRLALHLKWLAASLYVLVSALLALRLVQAVDFLDSIASRYQSMPKDSLWDPLRLAIAWLRGIVWTAGTAMTVVFIFHGGASKRGRKRQDGESPGSAAGAGRP